MLIPLLLYGNLCLCIIRIRKNIEISLMVKASTSYKNNVHLHSSCRVTSFETGSKLIKIAPYPNSSAIYCLTTTRGHQTIEFSMPYLQTNRSFIFYTWQSIVLSFIQECIQRYSLLKKQICNLFTCWHTLSQTEASLFLKVTPISSA